VKLHTAPLRKSTSAEIASPAGFEIRLQSANKNTVFAWICF